MNMGHQWTDSSGKRHGTNANSPAEMRHLADDYERRDTDTYRRLAAAFRAEADRWERQQAEDKEATRLRGNARRFATIEKRKAFERRYGG